MERLAVLALAAAALPACAVTLYGQYETGLSYSQGHSVTGAREHAAAMQPALLQGSWWGFRAQEALGAVRIGFVAESGFDSDSGAIASGQGGRLFGRTAALEVRFPWGSLRAGRLPSLVADSGSPLSAAAAANPLALTDRISRLWYTPYIRQDNAAEFVSAPLAGLQAALHASLAASGQERTPGSRNWRDLAACLAAARPWGQVRLAWETVKPSAEAQIRPPQAWSLAGNVQATERLRIFAGAQWAHNARQCASASPLSFGAYSAEQGFAGSHAGFDGLAASAGVRWTDGPWAFSGLAGRFSRKDRNDLGGTYRAELAEAVAEYRLAPRTSLWADAWQLRGGGMIGRLRSRCVAAGLRHSF